MTSKYPLILGLQMLIIHIDILFNAAATLLFGRNTVLLMIYMLQDTLILMSLIILVITFSSTFVFQAGLIVLLLRRFSASLITAFVYLALSILLHYLSLGARWENPTKNIWTPWMLVLYVAHKYVAVLYYASYKRAALLLSDPKYHGISNWLREKVRETN